MLCFPLFELLPDLQIHMTFSYLCTVPCHLPGLLLPSLLCLTNSYYSCSTQIGRLEGPPLPPSGTHATAACSQFITITVFIAPTGCSSYRLGPGFISLLLNPRSPHDAWPVVGPGMGVKRADYRQRLWGQMYLAGQPRAIDITFPGLSPFISKMEIRNLVLSPWCCQEDPVLTLRSAGTVWGTYPQCYCRQMKVLWELQGAPHV